MILSRLTLCDFRAYAGVHNVDLVPRVKSGTACPIILVGGLNGTGKTSLLMAVKLALYGRHAVGMGTSKTDYERFIRECIHAVPGALVKSTSAFVELDFIHGKLGRRNRYVVRRSWQDVGREVRETLTLTQEDRAETSLSNVECQGFLNELVPLGVSDLFFFDGEKIADLAEDNTGRALGSAIHRLLGLDLVERLRGDLRVYMLRSEAKAADEDINHQIERLQGIFEERKAELAERQSDLAKAKEELQKLAIERDRLELRLAELGGGWARSREARQAEMDKLAEVLRRERRELRDVFAGIYPLTLASDAVAEALGAFADELASVRGREANELLRQFASTLKSRLGGDAHSDVDSVLADVLRPESHVEGDVDLSQRAFGRMEQVLQHDMPKVQVQVRLITKTLATREDELNELAREIGRAPDQASLVAEFSALAALNERIVDASAEVAVHERELKVGFANAIDLARLLRDKHTALSERRQLSRPLELAAGARVLLKDFQRISAERKIERLEEEFVIAFQRLARKEDVITRAVIDSRRFTVTLLSRGGSKIGKSQLSAGEKQIYAIAMLEALARTSGRRLPVIIDTPLGRLDSQHRANLVEHYFPHASHQVILLSTDTEVDDSFFRLLSPNVSHAYEIRYDEREQAASLHSGYFWRDQ